MHFYHPDLEKIIANDDGQDEGRCHRPTHFQY